MADEERKDQDLTEEQKLLLEMANNTVTKADYEALQNKYNNLFKEVASGQYHHEEEEPEKSEADKRKEFEQAVLEIRERKIHNPLEHMERLIKIDDYQREHGQRSIFAPSTGDLDEDTNRSVDRCRDLIETVIARADGSPEVASALLGNMLRDAR